MDASQLRRRLHRRKRRLSRATAVVATLATATCMPPQSNTVVYAADSSSGSDSSAYGLSEASWITTNRSSGSPVSSSPSSAPTTTLTVTPSPPSPVSTSTSGHDAIDINSIFPVATAYTTPPRLVYPWKAFTATSSGSDSAKGSSVGEATTLLHRAAFRGSDAIDINDAAAPTSPSTERTTTVSSSPEEDTGEALDDPPFVITTSIVSPFDPDDLVDPWESSGSGSGWNDGSGSGIIVLPPMPPNPIVTQFVPPLPPMPIVISDPVFEETLTPLPVVPVDDETTESPSPVPLVPSPSTPATTIRPATRQPAPVATIPSSTSRPSSTATAVPVGITISRNSRATQIPTEERSGDGAGSGSSSSSSLRSTPIPTTYRPNSGGAGSRTPEDASTTTPHPLPVASGPKSSPEPSTRRRFERGDTILPVDDSSGPTKWVVISPSQSPALVVRDDRESTNEVGSGEAYDTSAYAGLNYAASILAFASVVWLIVGPALTSSLQNFEVSELATSRGDPHRWEFGISVVFVQGIASISHVITTPRMPSYVLAFADAFSWTSFQPFQKAAIGEGRRRLDQVVLDGLVAFAARIGIREVDLLFKTVEGFLIVVFVLAVVFAIAFCIAKRRRSNRDVTRTLELSHTAHSFHRSLVGRTITGFVVCLWFFALYPLALMSSYEIAMEARSSAQLNLGAIAVAIITLAAGCLGGLVACALCIHKLRTPLAMHIPRNAVVWGSLYGGVRVEQRLFFVVIAAVQLARGVTVGTIDRATVQLAVLLTMDVAVVAVVLVVQPFELGSPVRHFTLAVFGLRIVSTALLFAFSTESASWSARRIVGATVVVLYAAVTVLWFVRHAWMVWRLMGHQLAPRNSDSSCGYDHPEATEIRTPSPSRESDALAYEGAYARFSPDTAAGARIEHSHRKGVPYSGLWDELA